MNLRLLFSIQFVGLLAISLGGCGAEPSGDESTDYLSETLLCGNGKGIKPFHLDKCENKFSFFSVMTSKGGMKHLIDADGQRELTVVSADKLEASFEVFAPEVETKIERIFKSGDQGFSGLVGKLAGKKTTPLTMARDIRSSLVQSDLNKPLPLAAVMIAPALSIASGGGSQVWLDDVNHFINVGYASGANPDDVKTGRSFAAPGSRGALDASDPFYLTQLAKYLAAEDPEAFYEAIFRVLTSSDGSGIQSLSVEGQALITDFLAVYTAELDRHAMSNFKMHPWENDLAEATWVSSYVVSSGKIMLRGELVAGKPKDFFGVGQNGSGIGVMRKDRRALQQAISKHYWAQKDPVITELAPLIGVREGWDVIQGLATYTTTPEKTAEVLANADRVSKLAATFMVQIGREANEITKSILGG